VSASEWIFIGLNFYVVQSTPNVFLDESDLAISAGSYGGRPHFVPLIIQLPLVRYCIQARSTCAPSSWTVEAQSTSRNFSPCISYDFSRIPSALREPPNVREPSIASVANFRKNYLFEEEIAMHPSLQRGYTRLRNM